MHMRCCYSKNRCVVSSWRNCNSKVSKRVGGLFQIDAVQQQWKIIAQTCASSSNLALSYWDFASHRDVTKHCVQEIHDWCHRCASRRLQPPKLNWSGLDQAQITARRDAWTSLCMLAKRWSSHVRNFGVLLNEELTMNQHISKMVCVAFYHIRRLSKVRFILGAEITVASPSTRLHHTACSECGSQTYQRFIRTRDDTSTARPTFAAYSACHIWIVWTYASGA